MTANLIYFSIFVIFIATNVADSQHPCKTFTDQLNRLSTFCNSDDLKEIPSDINKSIEVFHLTGTVSNYFNVAWSTIFKELPELIECKISFTNIKLLPKNSFEKSKKLSKLDLSNNKINHFDIETFNNLINLKELNLSFNRIFGFPSHVFTLLNNQLRILDLSFNQIQLLDSKNLGNLTNLIVLNLAGNHLKSLNENVIFEMRNLKTLNLSRNNLNNLDCELFNKIPNIEIIDLSNNRFSSFNENYFRNLTKLRILNLNSNNLNILNDNTFHSLNLNILDLTNNNINEISKFTFNYLNCSNLILSYNFNLNIDQLKISLKSILNLENLDLSYTNIKDNDLNTDTFKDLSYTLLSLNLSNNQLTHLPKLSNLIKIKELDFSNNQIKLLNVSEIYTPDIYDKLKKHQTNMYLQNNPFSCFKCELEAILIYTKLNRKCLNDDYYCVKCYEPFNLKGQNIRDLNITDMISCGLPQRLTRFYESVKPSKISYIIVIIIIVVIVSIFLFLLILYRRRVCSAVYYTKEPIKHDECLDINYEDQNLNKRNSAKELVAKNIYQISTLKKELEKYYQDRQRKSIFKFESIDSRNDEDSNFSHISNIQSNLKNKNSIGKNSVNFQTDLIEEKIDLDNDSILENSENNLIEEKLIDNDVVNNNIRNDSIKLDDQINYRESIDKKLIGKKSISKLIKQESIHKEELNKKSNEEEIISDPFLV